MSDQIRNPEDRRDSFGAMAESWKKLKTSNVFLWFIDCSNQNRSALVRDLLSNNSLFVGQLYKDSSLQLTSKQRITIQQITARADLFPIRYTYPTLFLFFFFLQELLS